MALYDIIVNIAADTAALVTGMEKAESSVKSFANVVKTTFAALGAAELVSFTEKTLAAGAAMEHAIQISGATSEGFQKLAYAAGTVGVSTETLSSAMTRMGRNISQAGSGTKTQTEALTALGLSFEKLKALKPEDQFELLGRQIAALKNPMDQARASQALFGRAFQELLPLFKQSSEEMARLKDAAPILSDEQLDNLTKAHKSVSELAQSLDYLAEVLLSKVAKGISGFAKSIADLASGKITGADFMSQVIEVYRQGFAALQNWQAGGEVPGSNLRRGVIERPGIAPPDSAPPGYADLSGLSQLTGIHPTIGRIKPGEFGGPGFSGDTPPSLIAEYEGGLQGAGRAQEELNTKVQQLVAIWKSGDFKGNTEEYVKDMVYLREQYDQVADKVDVINVHMKRMLIPINEAQVAMHFFVDTFEQVAYSAYEQGGNIGKNFLSGMLKALENKAIFDAIQRIGDALRAALSEQAAAGSGIFGVVADVFGYGGAPVGGNENAAIGGGPTSKGVSRRSQGMNLTYNIDARGADAQRIMTVMPALLAQSSAKAKSDLLDAFHRGGYAAPRNA